MEQSPEPLTLFFFAADESTGSPSQHSLLLSLRALSDLCGLNFRSGFFQVRHSCPTRSIQPQISLRDQFPAAASGKYAAAGATVFEEVNPAAVGPESIHKGIDRLIRVDPALQSEIIDEHIVRTLCGRIEPTLARVEEPIFKKTTLRRLRVTAEDTEDTECPSI